MKKLTAELLERVNLSHAAKRAVKGYSGGMRQRLGIAQAIAGNPRLIIVDEPTAGLDPEERLRFYHLLSELAQDRIVILSTHIVEDVAVLCPRFAVIRSGRLLTVTTPSEARAAIAGACTGTVEVGDLPRLRSSAWSRRRSWSKGKNKARFGEPSDRRRRDSRRSRSRWRTYLGSCAWASCRRGRAGAARPSREAMAFLERSRARRRRRAMSLRRLGATYWVELGHTSRGPSSSSWL
jgi:ABC-type multidrug transport system ATPase subunit